MALLPGVLEIWCWVSWVRWPFPSYSSRWKSDILLRSVPKKSFLLYPWNDRLRFRSTLEYLKGGQLITMLLILSNKKFYSISYRILSKYNSLNNRKQHHSTDPLNNLACSLLIPISSPSHRIWIVVAWQRRYRGIIRDLEYHSVCSFVRIAFPRPLSRKGVCHPPWN